MVQIGCKVKGLHLESAGVDGENFVEVHASTCQQTMTVDNSLWGQLIPSYISVFDFCR